MLFQQLLGGQQLSFSADFLGFWCTPGAAQRFLPARSAKSRRVRNREGERGGRERERGRVRERNGLRERGREGERERERWSEGKRVRAVRRRREREKERERGEGGRE